MYIGNITIAFATVADERPQLDSTELILCQPCEDNFKLLSRLQAIVIVVLDGALFVYEQLSYFLSSH